MKISKYDKLMAIDITGLTDRLLEISKPEKWDSFFCIQICYVCIKIKENRCEDPDRLFVEVINEEEKISCNNMMLRDTKDELTDSWDLVVQLSREYSTEEFEAYVIRTDWGSGIPITPNVIYRLVDELLEIKQGERIGGINIENLGFSDFVMSRHLNNPFIGYGDTYSGRAAFAYRRNVLGCKNYEMYGQLYGPTEFEKMFIDEIEAIELDGSFTDEDRCAYIENWEGFPKNISATWDQCGMAIMSITEEGKAIALMRAGALNSKPSVSIRELLIRGEFIEGVIALPKRLYEDTSTDAFLLILKKNSRGVKFLDARETYSRLRTNKKKMNTLLEKDIEQIVADYNNAMEVPLEMIEKNDFVLMPQRYCKTKEYKDSVLLEDCVSDIGRGFSFSSKEIDELVIDNEGAFMDKCILPSCIENGIVTKKYGFGKCMYYYVNNMAHPGDILINKTGKPYRTAICDGDYVVIGNTYILRINKEVITPEYLSCFLESDAGQSALESLAVGDRTRILSIATLKKFEIPIFKAKKQKELNEKATELHNAVLSSYQVLTRSIEEIRSTFE